MKVIFIEDVPDIALAGETKDVADGYGRNYLLPKKLAVLANSAASNIVDAQLKKVVIKRAQAAAEMAEIADKINGTEITITAKAGEKERLYGSVTSADIAETLGSSTGAVIDKRKIELEEPIRQLGSYEITVRFTHDITADIRVIVETDQVAEEKEEKEERKPRAKKEEKPEEAEVPVEEAKAEVDAAGVKEEVGVTVEEPKVKKKSKKKAKAEGDEAEVKVVEAETVDVAAEVEKPKAKKKSKKKAEGKAEAETKVEAVEEKAEEVAEKEAEPGE